MSILFVGLTTRKDHYFSLTYFKRSSSRFSIAPARSTLSTTLSHLLTRSSLYSHSVQISHFKKSHTKTLFSPLFRATTYLSHSLSISLTNFHYTSSVRFISGDVGAAMEDTMCRRRFDARLSFALLKTHLRRQQIPMTQGWSAVFLVFQ